MRIRWPGAWVLVAMQLLFGGLVVLIKRKPHLFDFPARQRFLARPEADRAPVVEAIVGVLDACAFGVQAVFILVLGVLWDAAQGDRSTFGAVSLLVLTVVLTPTLSVLMSRLDAIVEREERRVRAAAR